MSTDLDLRALSVPCPLCRAGVNRPCRDEQGKEAAAVHVARIDAYTLGMPRGAGR